MPLNARPLQDAISGMYADAWLPGIKDALAQMPSPQRTIFSEAADAVDWEHWTPGHPPLPKDIRSLGFDPMAADAGSWLREIDATTCRQVAEILHDGVERGLGVPQIAAGINEVLGKPSRARMITVTETNRALSRASFATMQAYGERWWDLLTASDPCPVCATLAAGNPHPMSEIVHVPIHPSCRCAVAPARRF